MSGNLTINKLHSGTSNVSSFIYLGNNIPEGQAGSSRGVVNLYGKGSSFVQLVPETITSNRTIYFPDKGGTFAVTTDIANALAWNSIGYVVYGDNGLDIPTNYTEFYIQPAIYQANYNSFLVIRNNLNNFFISIYESSSNYLYGKFTFSNNKLTFTMSQTAGWGGSTTPKFYIYGR